MQRFVMFCEKICYLGLIGFLGPKGQADCAAKDIRGNYILIRHADKEYGLLAHLKPGSIRVKPGDIVKRGQHLADCGNSGNTSEPHLHFHLQDGRSLFTSAGLPIHFTDIVAQPAPGYAAYDPRPIPAVSIINESFIMRGQNVSNTPVKQTLLYP